MHGIAPPSPCAEGGSQRPREGKRHVTYKSVSYVSSLFLPAPASHEVRSKETAGCGNSDGEARLGCGAPWDERGGRAGGKLVSFSLAFPLPLILLLFLLPPAPYRRLCAPFLFENCILSVSHGSSEHLRRFTASRICRCGARTRAGIDPPLPILRGRGEPRYQLEVA